MCTGSETLLDSLSYSVMLPFVLKWVFRIHKSHPCSGSLSSRASYLLAVAYAMTCPKALQSPNWCWGRMEGGYQCQAAGSACPAWLGLPGACRDWGHCGFPICRSEVTGFTYCMRNCVWVNASDTKGRRYYHNVYLRSAWGSHCNNIPENLCPLELLCLCNCRARMGRYDSDSYHLGLKHSNHPSPPLSIHFTY